MTLDQIASATSATATCHKALVGGATGFLGRKILRNLESESGLASRAMSKLGAPADAGTNVEWVCGEMMDPTKGAVGQSGL